MKLSLQAKLICGITLLGVPAVMVGGSFLLGILTGGVAGFGGEGMTLTETQWGLYRAAHAHAGVWMILSLVIQILLDAARLSVPLKWIARISAPLAAVAVSGGFFGLAFHEGFQWLLYFGSLNLTVTVLLTGIGLLRRENG